jgi:phage terminase large subunit-like protein
MKIKCYLIEDTTTGKRFVSETRFHLNGRVIAEGNAGFKLTDATEINALADQGLVSSLYRQEM